MLASAWGCSVDGLSVRAAAHGQSAQRPRPAQIAAVHFAARRIEATIKYIDPSYIIRSLPTNAIDSEFCLVLGQHAVHAGMAGRTDMVVGFWHQRFTHMPIALAVGQRKQLDPQGLEWQSVLQTTGQPAVMVGK